jgi:hypothetical protein
MIISDNTIHDIDLQLKDSLAKYQVKIVKAVIPVENATIRIGQSSPKYV